MSIFGIFYFKNFFHGFINNMYSEQNLKIMVYYDINKLESLTLNTLSNCNVIEELFKLINKNKFHWKKWDSFDMHFI